MGYIAAYLANFFKLFFDFSSKMLRLILKISTINVAISYLKTPLTLVGEGFCALKSNFYFDECELCYNDKNSIVDKGWFLTAG